MDNTTEAASHLGRDSQMSADAPPSYLNAVMTLDTTDPSNSKADVESIKAPLNYTSQQPVSDKSPVSGTKSSLNDKDTIAGPRRPATATGTQIDGSAHQGDTSIAHRGTRSIGVTANLTEQAVDNNCTSRPHSMAPATDALVADGPNKVIHVETSESEQEHRETWGKKLDFLLSVIGFAVDLGNVWRFPYVCYINGGGAFLIPYLVMLIFGGLPLFYMELALGQYQRCGCISVWSRICPMFKGIGFGICVIASFVAMYYNTIIAWSVYFLFASFRRQVPWADCYNDWNTGNCTTNKTIAKLYNDTTSPAAEFFHRSVLEIHRATDLGHVGNVKWSIALCLMAVFTMVYFSLWKGIKSSGKAVWITATFPYVVLVILLIRGVTLPGSLNGIIYYLNPQWNKLADVKIWIAAAQQIFFSLGPGFGVLLALSSYNKFNNNCYKDALITATINCFTSFMAGFVVFSVLGYMAYKQDKDIVHVADQGPGLVFVVYPEAIATFNGSTFWAIIFFLMLITLGLDSTFGGLEALITGICDEWPAAIGKRRELFVLGLMIYCFFGALPTTTYGGMWIVNLLDAHGAPISILFICFLEAASVHWFYGTTRFSSDMEQMLGFKPGIFWRVCWLVISPIFLLTLFILAIVTNPQVEYEKGRPYPQWGIMIGWLVTSSSLICIPAYLIYRLLHSKGSIKERWAYMVTPEDAPKHTEEIRMTPVYL